MAIVKPSSTASLSVVSDSSSLTTGFKKPPRKVLDEDDYVAKMETIITRDFFPDIAKLRAQSEYLEAVDRNDLGKIRELQMKYSRRRTDQTGVARTPRVDASPDTFETPDISRKGTDRTTEESVSSPRPHDHDEQPSSSSVAENESSDKSDDLTLDKFLSRFTSEDNDSYAEIINLAERKRRQRLDWMYRAEHKHNLKFALTNSEELLPLPESEKLLALPSTNSDETSSQISESTVATGLSGAEHHQSVIQKKETRPLAPEGWSYQAINSVMWVPDEAPLTAEEKHKRRLLAEREIVHGNTRFRDNPFSESASEDSMSRALGIHSALNKGHVDFQGNEVCPKRPGTQFSYVVTPSPAPGVNESPMMTWGEIEGTPFRLDASDMPILPKVAGPSFKIPEVPTRDSIGHTLAEDVGRRYRKRKEKAMEEVSHNFASPIAKFGSAKSLERLNEMSPAARRLATSKLGIRLSTDRALKASYSPSPIRSRGGEKTPVIITATPKDVRTPEVGKTPGSRRDAKPVSLTDNLLNLESVKPGANVSGDVGAKRPRAEDFF